MTNAELIGPSWQEEAMRQNALLHQTLSRAARLEAALREIRDIAEISEGGEFYVMLVDRALEGEQQ